MVSETMGILYNAFTGDSCNLLMFPFSSYVVTLDPLIQHRNGIEHVICHFNVGDFDKIAKTPTLNNITTLFSAFQFMHDLFVLYARYFVLSIRKL